MWESRTQLDYADWQRDVWPGYWDEWVAPWREDLETAAANPDAEVSQHCARFARQELDFHEQHREAFMYDTWVREYAMAMNPDDADGHLDRDAFWAEIDPDTRRWRVVRQDGGSYEWDPKPLFYSVNQAPLWMLDRQQRERSDECGY
jgi:hypothetical protein